MAFGLAALFQRGRDLLRRRDVLARAFDVALVAIAVVVIVQGYRTPLDYPFPGSATAARYIDAHLRPDDAVLLPGPSLYAFADTSKLRVRVVPTPKRQVGFTLHFADPRVQSTGYWGEIPQTPESIRKAVGNARRIFIPADGVFGGGVANALGAMLKPEGYTATTLKFGSGVVMILQK
jgi:hypothetical protein